MIDPLRPVQPGLDPVQPPVAPHRTARERREEDERRRKRGRTPAKPVDDEGSDEDDGLPHIDVRA